MSDKGRSPEGTGRVQTSGLSAYTLNGVTLPRGRATPVESAREEDVLQTLALDLIAVAGATDLFEALDRALVPLFDPLFSVASFAFSPDGPMTIWRSAPAPEHSPEWWARNQAMHPGIEWLRHNVGAQVVRVSDVLPDAELVAHPYYAEFMRPEGWHYSVGMFLWQRGRPVGMVAANRARALGDYDERDVEAMRRVRALVEPAYLRLARGSSSGQRTKLFEEFLRELPVPMFVFRPSTGTVEYANRMSRRVLARWRGEEHLKTSRVLRLEDVPRELRDACLELAEPRVFDHERLPLRARLRPLRDPLSLFAADQVLVSIEERDAPTSPSGAWLQAIRMLAPREQDVVRLAAAGRSNAEIAKRLGKSPATVKTQLEASYRKLGVASRTELVRLFHGAGTKRSDSI